MGGGLVGDEIGPHAALDQFREDVGGIALDGD